MNSCVDWSMKKRDYIYKRWMSRRYPWSNLNIVVIGARSTLLLPLLVPMVVVVVWRGFFTAIGLTLGTEGRYKSISVYCNVYYNYLNMPAVSTTFHPKSFSPPASMKACLISIKNALKWWSLDTKEPFFFLSSSPSLYCAVSFSTAMQSSFKAPILLSEKITKQHGVTYYCLAFPLWTEREWTKWSESWLCCLVSERRRRSDRWFAPWLTEWGGSAASWVESVVVYD